MDDHLKALEERARGELAAAATAEALGAWRSRYLGRDGELTLDAQPGSDAGDGQNP